MWWKSKAFQSTVAETVSCLTNLEMHVCLVILLFVILCTVAHQTPLSLGFSMQEYWSELPFPSPGVLPDLGTESSSSESLASIKRLFYFSDRTSWVLPRCWSSWKLFPHLPCSFGVTSWPSLTHEQCAEVMGDFWSCSQKEAACSLLFFSLCKDWNVAVLMGGHFRTSRWG